MTRSYDVQYKPIIERFHIAGLEVGEESDFFIYSEDVTRSYMRVETENHEVVFNQTFNGSKVPIKIDEIGNYAVYMQVYGAGWSETYYSEFTAFAGVPQIIDNVPLCRSTHEVHEHQTKCSRLPSSGMIAASCYISSDLPTDTTGCYPGGCFRICRT
ncbi:MAG: hypothetical protein U9N43_05360 [Euryarchaeota archaeon]|nr:hypothetical protein [Euryarchaeota archaeon]